MLTDQFAEMDLKDCPFCGGKAIAKLPRKSSWEQYEPSTPAVVGCEDCRMAATVPGYKHDALKIAVDMWQRRVGDAR